MSGEKRSQDREDTLHAETTIIVDIEGTTTSISFVKETLFPYVRENLKQYVEKNWEADEFKGDLEKLKEQAKKDETDKVEGVVSITGATPEEERDSVVKNVLWQMDGDLKTGALKQLQGHMWREAYKSGAVKGHVYEDVPKAFDDWTKSGRKIYVYSSGSVEAQKLLFSHSEHGDMSKYFSDYFDTEVGPKQEAKSYKTILEKIAVEPSSVLFLTDIVKEAQAAKEAGMSASIVVRQGNASLTDEEKVTFTTIGSFMDLVFQTSAKRQKIETSIEKGSEATAAAVAAGEPMDTMEDAAPIVEEKAAAKEESNKSAETVKIEATKTGDKTKVSRMETDSKDETEKKASDATDKLPVAEESKKNEDESKTSEKMEVAKEEAASEMAKVDTDEPEKQEGEATKQDTEAATKEIEVAKKETEAAGKESGVVKSASEITKKDNDTTKTEVSKVDVKPTDDGKNILPPKSEAIGKITEDKTEATSEVSESVPAASITETETKIVESVPEDKPKEVVEATSAPESSPTVAVETKPAERKPEDEKAATSVEKVEPEVAKATTEKSSAKVEEKAASEEVKQNGGGDSAPTKMEQVAAEKPESNGEAKEEVTKVGGVTADAEAPTAEVPEKKSETVDTETAKKDESAADNASNADEAASVESTDAKQNGTSQNGGDKTVSATDEKPHRNGLNGDSSTEKTNGKTKDEGANGETESSTSESIKVKKVVESTIAADGAGEPDVVPPVAVAATS